MCDRRPPEATVRYGFQIDKSWIDRNQRRSAPGDDWSGIEMIVEPDFGELHVDAGGTSIASQFEPPAHCSVCSINPPPPSAITISASANCDRHRSPPVANNAKLSQFWVRTRGYSGGSRAMNEAAPG
jgi:hypothetical protein